MMTMNLFSYRTVSSSIWVESWNLSVWRPVYGRKNYFSPGKNKKENTNLGKGNGFHNSTKGYGCSFVAVLRQK